jgi:hypothetical protein
MNEMTAAPTDKAKEVALAEKQLHDAFTNAREKFYQSDDQVAGFAETAGKYLYAEGFILRSQIDTDMNGLIAQEVAMILGDHMVAQLEQKKISLQRICTAIFQKWIIKARDARPSTYIRDLIIIIQPYFTAFATRAEKAELLQKEAEAKLKAADEQNTKLSEENAWMRRLIKTTHKVLEELHPEKDGTEMGETEVVLYNQAMESLKLFMNDA